MSSTLKYNVPSAVELKSGRDPLLISKLAVIDLVPGSAIWNDFAVADYPRGRHAKRLKDALVEKFVVGLAGNLVDQNAKENIIGVAVVSFFSWSRFDGQGLHFR